MQMNRDVIKRCAFMLLDAVEKANKSDVPHSTRRVIFVV